MNNFKPKKGLGYLHILLLTFLIDIVLIFSSYFVSTYELNIIIRWILIIFNIYQTYYILLFLTISYSINDKEISINSFFGLKKIKVSLEKIIKYKISSGGIKGVKLSGYGTNFYAFGRTVIEKIGTTRMFVTSNKSIIYIDTDDVNFAVSPEESEEFIKLLNQNNIFESGWEHEKHKISTIHKEKHFIILLTIASILVIVMTITPLVLYMQGKLPQLMPLKFDSSFIPVTMGTSKQFTFKQVTYGALNMAILFCMYFAATLRAKYDKKTAYFFIYASIFLSALFLFMQFKIIISFR